LTSGAGFTNYGSGSATLDYAIKIVLCWVIRAKNWLKDASIHVEQLKSKNVIFKVANKPIWDKKKKSKCGKNFSVGAGAEPYRNSNLRPP
jgi:hypothetical protein